MKHRVCSLSREAGEGWGGGMDEGVWEAPQDALRASPPVRHRNDSDPDLELLIARAVHDAVDR